jgi:hypothetical protein
VIEIARIANLEENGKVMRFSRKIPFEKYENVASSGTKKIVVVLLPANSVSAKQLFGMRFTEELGLGWNEIRTASGIGVNRFP